MSIPAVTMRLEMMKQDMRKGRKTGCPVSKLSASEYVHGAVGSYQDAAWNRQSSLPSISLESWILSGPAYKRPRVSSRLQDPKRRRIGFCALQPSAFL